MATRRAKKKTGIRIQQRYELVAVGGEQWTEIREHPENPNVGNVDAINESIEENGWYGAVLVQESTGFIVAGNHRWRKARDRGAEEIPVIWLDVDDATALKILLGDNKIAGLGVIDEEKLQSVMDQLPDLRGTGFGLEAIQTAEEEADAAADAEPEEPEEEAPVPDDVYEPNFGVMLICTSEDDQREVYQALQILMEEGAAGNDDRLTVLYGAVDEPRVLRVVAV